MTRLAVSVICAVVLIWCLAFASRRAWCQTVDVDSAADSLTALCHYTEAEPLFERALTLTRENVGDEDTLYALALNNLARNRFLCGNYAAAETMHREALAILKRELGPQHLEVGRTFTQLAEVVWKQRRFIEAESLSVRAISILCEASECQPIDEADALGMFATARRGQGEYMDAEEYYLRALETAETAYGPEHLNTVRLLNKIAALYVNVRRWDEAEDYAQRAITASAAILPAEHIENSRSLCCLGSVRMAASQYDEARQLYERALAIRRHVLGPAHPDVVSVLGSLWQTSYLAGDNESAMAYNWDEFRIVLSNYIRNSEHLSEYEANLFNMTIHYSLSSFLTTYVNLDHEDSLWRRRAADLVLTAKGLITEDFLARGEHYMESADTAVVRLTGELRDLQAEVSSLYFEDPQAAQPRTFRQRDSLEALQRYTRFKLSKLAPDNRRGRLGQLVTCDAVAAAIPPGAVLVEYYVFTHFERTANARETAHMVAVVLQCDGVKEIHHFGEVSDLNNMLPEYQTYLGAHAIPSGNGVAGPPNSHETLCDLYRRLVLPMQGDLAGATLLLIAPDHGLNQVSFASLIDADNRFLIERFPIQYVPSGRSLLHRAVPATSNRGLFILSDPDYDATPAMRLAAAPRDAFPHAHKGAAGLAMRSARWQCVDFDNLTIDPLPGTRSEAERIRERWKQNFGEPALVCLGSAASEEVLKRYAAAHRVVHLATHGFYLRESCQESMSANVIFEPNALYHSGLFMAGASSHSNGVQGTATEDGILSAAEVALLDFSGTDVVVLSACETGLGDESHGQGVVGLRSAFLIAGARSVICSLWPVSDAVTVDFMDHLYRFEGTNLPDIIRDFALSQIDGARQRSQFPDPYYWAPFIAIGDWDPLDLK